jgi:hypothetical protein
MSISYEIEKIRETIRSVEDPSTATALRHICKALEAVQREVHHAEGEQEKNKEEERLQ